MVYTETYFLSPRDVVPSRRTTRLHARTLAALGITVAALTLAPLAAALPNGIAAPDCSGCHGSDAFDGDISLTPSSELQPGQKTDFTLTINESHMLAAGFYVSSGGLGTFSVASGSGAKLLGGEIVQSQPLVTTNGSVTLNFSWTPPVDPGATRMQVSVVAADHNGSNSGDRTAQGALSLVWGCDGVPLYGDIDGDGYGTDVDVSLGCAASEGWSLTDDDCNDLYPSIHPGATEIANGKDDDCNGVVDDGFEVQTLYPDVDGDGYGGWVLTPIETTGSVDGYVNNSDDCDDSKAEVFPGAVETCDGIDNNCDHVVDEGMQQYCGVGRCARLLTDCRTECVPGAPEPETCNGLDDDCDGEVDDDVQCPAGQACIEFRCQTVVDAATARSIDDASTVNPEASTTLTSSSAPENASDAAAPIAATATHSAGSVTPPLASQSADVDAAQSVSPLTPGTPSAASSIDTSHAARSSCDCNLGRNRRGTGAVAGLAWLALFACVRRRFASKRSE